MDGAFGPRWIDETLAAFQAHLGLGPSTILVDGFGWEEPGVTATVSAVKASAARIGAELWMTARDARAPERAARVIAPLSDDCAALVDVGVFLEPHGRHARLTLVKDFKRFPAADVPLVIAGGTRRLPADDDAPSPPDLS